MLQKDKKDFILLLYFDTLRLTDTQYWYPSNVLTAMDATSGMHPVPTLKDGTTLESAMQKDREKFTTKPRTPPDIPVALSDPSAGSEAYDNIPCRCRPFTLSSLSVRVLW